MKEIYQVIKAWRGERTKKQASAKLGMCYDNYLNYELPGFYFKATRTWRKLYQAGCIIPPECFPKDRQMRSYIEEQLGIAKPTPQKAPVKNLPKGTCGRSDTICFNAYCYREECKLRGVAKRPMQHSPVSKGLHS